MELLRSSVAQAQERTDGWGMGMGSNGSQGRTRGNHVEPHVLFMITTISDANLFFVCEFWLDETKDLSLASFGGAIIDGGPFNG